MSADIPVLSKDGTSTIGQLRFTDQVPSDATLDAVRKPPGAAGSSITTSVGGDAYKATTDPSKVPELPGLLISFLILASPSAR